MGTGCKPVGESLRWFESSRAQSLFLPSGMPRNASRRGGLHITGFLLSTGNGAAAAGRAIRIPRAGSRFASIHVTGTSDSSS